MDKVTKASLFPSTLEMPSGETEHVFFIVQNIQLSARRPNSLNWEGMGSEGRYGGVGSFSNFGRSLDSGESRGGGGAPGGWREACQDWLAPVMHILGRKRESLDEEISRNCREGRLFSAYVFAKA